jgi:hydroxypyruvate reductase
MVESAQTRTLRRLFEVALERVDPNRCLASALPEPPQTGRLILLAAGKAAAAMAQAAERYYLERGDAVALEGIAASRRGFDLPTRIVQLIEAGHPIPDDNSLAAAERALELAHAATSDDLVLVLLSGGASALWTAPAAGVALGEKQAITRQLLACGAPISEINCVRKHLSRIKGGRLAQAAHPARTVTLAISDVAGDDPATIGSGPTVGDPTTLEDAICVLETHRIPIGPGAQKALGEPENETPAADDPVFAGATYRIIARASDALAAAASAARAMGYEPHLLGDALEGEARALARQHAKLARDLKLSRGRAVLLSGGEATVNVKGTGRGGPNQEYALALAVALEAEPGVWALAADTDGNDGGSGAPTDPAGAIVEPETLARARAAGLDPQMFLENNDSTGFFALLGDLLITGPTFTNVNDFRAILVEA